MTPMEMASMKWFGTLTSAACVLVVPTLANLCRAENVQSGPPGYIEADRTQAEKMLGRALAGDIFSDRFTALRKRLIASSLRANPTAGCGEPPAFTLQTVAAGETTAEGSAWQERYLIRCKQDVRRTFLLFLSAKDGMKSMELTPGGTIADMTLQRDVLQGATTAALINRAAPTKCKNARVRDSRVTHGTGLSNTPWTEVWVMDVCGTSIDVEIKFTPSPQGGTDWSIH
jgi:hypothetical protein